MRTMRHPSIPALASLIAVLLLPSCETPPPACDLGLVDHLDIERAVAHIAYLSDSIGPRVVSTPQEREAAEYIAAELESYGYDVEIQEFQRPTVHAYLTVEDSDKVAPDNVTPLSPKPVDRNGAPSQKIAA